MKDKIGRRERKNTVEMDGRKLDDRDLEKVVGGVIKVVQKPIAHK